MERVMGLGGLFLKATDKVALSAWYRDNLGVAMEDWGGAVFNWKDHNPQGDAMTVWSLFSSDTDYFAPSTKGFMMNFRVRDLDAMLNQLRNNGCAVDDKTEDSEFGRFSWVMDPEGNRVELWEPPPAAAAEAATEGDGEN